MMLGREQELALLGALLGVSTAPTGDANVGHEHEQQVYSLQHGIPCVVLYGQASTGKTLCMKHLIHKQQQHRQSTASAEMNAAFVDCLTVFKKKHFFMEILQQLYAISSQTAAFAMREVDASMPQVEQVPEEDGMEETKERYDEDDDHDDDDHDEAYEEEEQAQKQRKKSKKQHGASSKRPSEDGHANDRNPSLTSGSYMHFVGFLRAIRRLLKQQTGTQKQSTKPNSLGGPKPSIWIVLDNAQVLVERSLEQLLVSTLRLPQQLEQVAACSVICITQGLSPALEKLLFPFMPAFVHFPRYSFDQVGEILIQQFALQQWEPLFRKWLQEIDKMLVHQSHDWIDFRRIVVQLLPTFERLVVENRVNPVDSRSLHKAVQSGLQSLRHAHLHGLLTSSLSMNASQESKSRINDDLINSSAGSIECSHLSRGCLLLLLAGYLASFTPEENDDCFLTSLPLKKKGRKRKTPTATDSSESRSSMATRSSAKSRRNASLYVNQLKIGPKAFHLQRLLALHSSLAKDSCLQHDALFDSDEELPISPETREDVLGYLSQLLRMQLFQRVSSPQEYDDLRFRCVAEADLVQHVASLVNVSLANYFEQP